MSTIIGTTHFRSFNAACFYRRPYGFNRQEKVSMGNGNEVGHGP